MLVSNPPGPTVKRIALSLHDQTIELRDAAGLGDDLEILFECATAEAVETCASTNSRHVVTIAREPDEGFTLQPANGPPKPGLPATTS